MIHFFSLYPRVAINVNFDMTVVPYAAIETRVIGA